MALQAKLLPAGDWYYRTAGLTGWVEGRARAREAGLGLWLEEGAEGAVPHALEQQPLEGGRDREAGLRGQEKGKGRRGWHGNFVASGCQVVTTRVMRSGWLPYVSTHGGRGGTPEPSIRCISQHPCPTYDPVPHAQRHPLSPAAAGTSPVNYSRRGHPLTGLPPQQQR